MHIKYLLISLCLLSAQYALSFKSNRYKMLLRDHLNTLEMKQERLAKKIASHQASSAIPPAGRFGLSEEQQESLKASREEFIKQLTAKQENLSQRIKAVKAQQSDLIKNPPKNAQEEVRAIKKATEQQAIAHLQEQIADITLSQSILVKQRDERKQSGIEVPDEQALPSFIERWAIERAELEEQLKSLQAGVEASGTR